MHFELLDQDISLKNLLCLGFMIRGRGVHHSEDSKRAKLMSVVFAFA